MPAQAFKVGMLGSKALLLLVAILLYYLLYYTTALLHSGSQGRHARLGGRRANRGCLPRSGGVRAGGVRPGARLVERRAAPRAGRVAGATRLLDD